MSNIQVTKKQFTGLFIQICFCKRGLCTGSEYSSSDKANASTIPIGIMINTSLVLLVEVHGASVKRKNKA